MKRLTQQRIEVDLMNESLGLFQRRRITTSGKSPSPGSLPPSPSPLKLHEKAELHLTDHRHEFGLVSSTAPPSSPTTPASSDLFFYDIEFEDSQSSFSIFGINSLPRSVSSGWVKCVWVEMGHERDMLYIRTLDCKMMVI